MNLLNTMNYIEISHKSLASIGRVASMRLLTAGTIGMLRHALKAMLPAAGMLSIGLTSWAQNAPIITLQPTNQTVAVGGDTTLDVMVSGTGPLAYQWQFNRTNLAAIIVFAGGGRNGAQLTGDGVPATNAVLGAPAGVAADGAGNVFIADAGNNCVRRVGTNGIITTVAGNGAPGYAGDGGAATNSELNRPFGVAVDGAGNLLIADTQNNRVRKVGTNGLISTVLGGAPASGGGTATNASLLQPYGVAADVVGNVFVADSFNNRVLRIGTNGIVTVVAGNGVAGHTGDGGAATNASLGNPVGLAVDESGNLFIAESLFIRKVNTNGVIMTVAGGDSTVLATEARPPMPASPMSPAWRLIASGTCSLRTQGTIASARSMPTALLPRSRLTARPALVSNPMAWRWMAREICSWRTTSFNSFLRSPITAPRWSWTR